MIGSFLHACNLQAKLCIKLYNSHVIVVDCKPFRSNYTLALYRKLLLCKPFRPDWPATLADHVCVMVMQQFYWV